MKKLIIVIILLLIVGYYANLKYSEQKLEKNNDIILISNDDLPDKKNSFEKESLHSEIENDKLIFELESVSLKYANRCGFSIDNIENVRNMFTTLLNNKPMTEKQNNVINKLVDGCFDWYDYLADKDEALESELTEKIHLKNNLVGSLSFGNLDNDSILEARGYFDSEDPDIASAALIHLLKFDSELKDYIFQRVSFQDRNYLYNHSIQIAAMYSCHLSRDCGVYSDTSLTSCLINENSCGLSFYERMNQLHSQSQIIEMENIIEIIINKKD